MFPNIKAEIARNNLTICELAKKLKVNRKTVSKWINEGNIPASALIKMAELFNVSIDYLLEKQNK